MRITKGKATVVSTTGEASISYEIHYAESDREGFMSDFKNGWPSKADIHITGVLKEGANAFILRALIENDLVGKLTEEQAMNDRNPFMAASAKRVFMLAYYKDGRKIGESRIPVNGPVCDQNGHSAFSGLTSDAIYNSPLWDSVVGDKPSVAERPALEQDIPTDEEREEWIKRQDEITAEMEQDPDVPEDQVKLRKVFLDGVRKQIEKMKGGA